MVINEAGLLNNLIVPYNYYFLIKLINYLYTLFYIN